MEGDSPPPSVLIGDLIGERCVSAWQLAARQKLSKRKTGLESTMMDNYFAAHLAVRSLPATAFFSGGNFAGSPNPGLSSVHTF